MFRKMIALIVVALLLQPTLQAVAKTELLPEVAAILQDIQTPDLASLKLNVFVGLLSMHAPADMDYMAIGSEVVLNNLDYHKRALTGQDMGSLASDHPEHHFNDRKKLELQSDIDGESYLFPCYSAGNYGCIEEILAQKEAITHLTKGNATLMQRYLHIREMPYWKTYAYNVADPMPSYATVMFLSYLRIAQAVISFEEGKAEQGFDLLQEEMAFARKMLGQSELLVEKMVAVRLLYVNYHTISELLDTPSMRPFLDDSRLNTLLAPLTDNEQKALATSYRFERNMLLYLFNTIGDEESLVPFSPERDAQDAQLEQTNQDLLSERCDPEATSNIFYLMYEPVINRASLSLQKVSDLYAQNALNSTNEQALHIFQQQISLPTYTGNNKIGEAILEAGLPFLDDYTKRLYDVQIYSALVRAKRLLLISGLDTQDDSMIEAFLQQREEAVQNPVTSKAFSWHAEKRLLTTDWIAPSYYTVFGIEKGEPAGVHIR